MNNTNSKKNIITLIKRISLNSGYIIIYKFPYILYFYS